MATVRFPQSPDRRRCWFKLCANSSKMTEEQCTMTSSLQSHPRFTHALQRKRNFAPGRGKPDAVVVSPREGRAESAFTRPSIGVPRGEAATMSSPAAPTFPRLRHRRLPASPAFQCVGARSRVRNRWPLAEVVMDLSKKSLHIRASRCTRGERNRLSRRGRELIDLCGGARRGWSQAHH